MPISNAQCIIQVRCMFPSGFRVVRNAWVSKANQVYTLYFKVTKKGVANVSSGLITRLAFLNLVIRN